VLFARSPSFSAASAGIALSASGNFSGPSRQILQQLADGQARFQQPNHLIRADSCFCAQRNNLGDGALQSVFLRSRKRVASIATHGCGEILFYRHSNPPRLCKTLDWIPRGNIIP